MNYGRVVRRRRPRRGVTAQYQLAEMRARRDAETAALPEPAPADAAEPLTTHGPAVWPASAKAATGVMAAAGPAPLQAADPAPSAVPPALPAPRLLVLVTTEPAPSPLAVTEAPENAPSYARAIALRLDANGGAMWTQATTSDDGSGTKMALVILGSNPGQQGEE